MKWLELVELQVELNGSHGDFAVTAVQDAVRSRMWVLDGEQGAHGRHMRRRLALQRWAGDPPRSERQAAEARLLSRLPVFDGDPASWDL